MNIIQSEYRVIYDDATATVTCAGAFRLHGEEYGPVLDLMTEAANAKPPLLTLDVRELQFLNSSGINTLAKLILQVRKLAASQVLVMGSDRFPWQAKSLKNLQRLLPGLRLEMG